VLYILEFALNIVSVQKLTNHFSFQCLFSHKKIPDRYVIFVH